MSTDTPRLIFTGNVIVDLVLTVDRLPELGGDMIASSSRIAAGGGFTVMLAAKRDGLDVLFAGQYGTGPFGSVVRAALAEEELTAVQDGLPDVESGYCVTLVDSRAERTFITVVGAEAQLRPEDLRRVRPRPNDLVHVSGYSLAHAASRTALTDWLPGLPLDVPVITDPGPLIGELDPTTLAAVLARTDVLSLNAREARISAGTNDLGAAADVLLGRIRTGGSVVLRDGATGCWLTSAESRRTLVPGFAVEAIDSTGAGDTHCGVLAAGLAAGLGLDRAARRANAAAALATTWSGPGGAPTATQIDAKINRG